MKSLVALLVSIVVLPICHSQTTISCPPITVCYVIDESSSINAPDFMTQATAVIDITDGLEALAPGSIFGAVGFSTTAKTVSPITTNINAFKNEIDRNLQDRGFTASGAGILLCDSMLEREAAPKVLVVITDGEDTRSPSGVSVIDGVKAKGVIVATIGVGAGTSKTDLLRIASTPDLYIPIKDYATLPKKANKIVQSLCGAIPSLSSSPIPPPPPKPTCAVVECGLCEKVMECYVNSGSPLTDKKACAAVTTEKTFCSFKKFFTDCGQQCKCTNITKCYTREDLPIVHNMRGTKFRICKTKSSSGGYARMSSVASYNVCYGKPLKMPTVTCKKRKCGFGGIRNYRCDYYCV